MSNLRYSKTAWLAGAFSLAILATSSLYAQDRRYRDRDDRYYNSEDQWADRIPPGAVIPVRTEERIDVYRQNQHVYPGVVENDVYSDDGRIAIPRGARADLVVRVARDNDLILDLDAVYVNGYRYPVRAENNRVESQQNPVGAIVGAITGGEVRGRAVDVPRDSVLNFRLERPMWID